VGRREAGGELLQAVPAGVRDGRVQRRDAGLGAPPPPRGLPPDTAVGADAAHGLAVPPPQLSLRYVEVTRGGDDLTGREHREGLDSQVDTDHRHRPPTPTTEAGRAGAGSARWISTENEQNQRPPWWVTVAWAEAGGAALDMPSQLPGRLVGAHRADAGQRHMPPVAVDQTDAAGGEPARQRPPFAP
jgi:hypothetical protein